MNSSFSAFPRNWAWVCIVLLITSSAASGQETVKVKRPNILVVLVDDMRWDEFGEAGESGYLTAFICKWYMGKDDSKLPDSEYELHNIIDGPGHELLIPKVDKW